MNQQKPSHHPIPTKWGYFEASLSSKGIVALKFPRSKKAGVGRSHEKISRKMTQMVTSSFNRYLQTGQTNWKNVPIDKTSWSKTQKKVWEALTRIPKGETRTYEWLAKRCGMPKGARAAGRILGANPIPIIYPCHRIVRKDGSLGGFSGGLNWKIKLLKHEQLNNSQRIF